MLSSFKGELKQQGAEEASRDPNSSVTAADAERVIMDESKKAGAVALEFDPDASPEEKAAQARSVCLCAPQQTPYYSLYSRGLQTRNEHLRAWESRQIS